MRRMALAVGVLLPALGSCDGVLDPEDVAGEYVLQGTPVVLQAGSGRLEILADTFRLNTDGSATRVIAESFESESGSYASERVEPYRYIIRRGRIELEYVCPINALCLPPPHLWGPRTRSGLTLRSIVDPRVSLHYTRILRGVITLR